jgi:hypothetical protein
LRAPRPKPMIFKIRVQEFTATQISSTHEGRKHVIKQLNDQVTWSSECVGHTHNNTQSAQHTLSGSAHITFVCEKHTFSCCFCILCVPLCVGVDTDTHTHTHIWIFRQSTVPLFRCLTFSFHFLITICPRVCSADCLSLSPKDDVLYAQVPLCSNVHLALQKPNQCNFFCIQIILLLRKNEKRLMRLPCCLSMYLPLLRNGTSVLL